MTGSSPITTPIFQFGTSRFLQAHVDLIVDESLSDGTAAGPITVIKTTSDAGRTGRLHALADPDGYPIRIRGLENGRIVDRTQQVHSIRRAFGTQTDWAQITRAFVADAQYVVSNTGDRGFDPTPADDGACFDQAMSYPAKLFLLLKARFHESGAPLSILPCELVERNGDRLKARILDLAKGEDPAFRTWLTKDVLWINALVDRIVSEPIDPAGAVAEPYVLWAIEDQPGFVPPCRHAGLQIVEDLDHFQALKLYVLNLGHTVLAEFWRALGGDNDALVRGFIADAAVVEALSDIYWTEVLPAFERAGLREEATEYVRATLERFRNPFLDHRIADIAQNHSAKIDRRLVGFLTWARQNGDDTPKPRLSKIVEAANV